MTSRSDRSGLEETRQAHTPVVDAGHGFFALMDAICCVLSLMARGNPLDRYRCRLMLWSMVLEFGRSRRVDSPPFRPIGAISLKRDVPQHRAHPSASEGGLQSKQRPLCDVPNGIGGQDRCAIHISECVHDQSLASFFAHDHDPGQQCRFSSINPRCSQFQSVIPEQNHGFRLPQLPSECQAQAPGWRW